MLLSGLLGQASLSAFLFDEGGVFSAEGWLPTVLLIVAVEQVAQLPLSLRSLVALRRMQAAELTLTVDKGRSEPCSRVSSVPLILMMLVGRGTRATSSRIDYCSEAILRIQIRRWTLLHHWLAHPGLEKILAARHC